MVVSGKGRDSVLLSSVEVVHLILHESVKGIHVRMWMGSTCVCEGVPRTSVEAVIKPLSVRKT